MGVVVHLKSSDAWSFFQKNKVRLGKEMVVIAENTDTDHTICLEEEQGLPLVSVYRADKRLCEEGAVSEKDCEDTVKGVYFKYLFPVKVVVADLPAKGKNEVEEDDGLLEEDISPEQMIEDEIYLREDSLEFAVTDFLEVLLSCSGPEQIKKLYGDIIQDFLDRVCTVLAEDFLISVYRPTWIDDDEGNPQYVEYPYLDVDDDDLPDIEDTVIK